MSLLLLFLAAAAAGAAAAAEEPAPNLYGPSYLIDCGGADNFTSAFHRHWLSDRYFSGGAASAVPSASSFPDIQSRTLRFFPPTSSGKKNCYSVPVPPGRYYLRTFTLYDNYDSRLRSPSFDVSFEGTLAFSWRSPWPEPALRSGAYSDLIAAVTDGLADLCFYSIATDAPVISSLEIVAINPLAYDSSVTGSDYILINYGRLTSGSDLFGPGFSIDNDTFGRVWQSDAEFRNPDIPIKALSPSGGRRVAGVDVPPNHFPAELYASAVTTVSTTDSLEYSLPVDARLDYMLWFHFAEIDSSVNAVGKRVFDVYVNGLNVRRIDVFEQVGWFRAFDWYYRVGNLTSMQLIVKLVPYVGRPLVCGIENYAMVPLDMATVPSQALAMKALKESLRVPDRMGWNGDPCAPSKWDAWEGVTCHRSDNRRGLVITQLDLGSQGLKGYISDKISLLSNLVSLNLSSNSLEGTLPSGLGQGSLVKLDLSTNQFSGSIPDSLGSSNLQVVLLNNNELEEQVPEKLYSIGVHGGVIDLSGNKRLCGVPTLPDCSFFWEKGGLSRRGKIAVGISCVVFLGVLLLMVYIFYIRRGRHDYDFGLPQDLISIASKRNRYQRQKSLMLCEMETQNSAGSHITMSPL